MFRGFTDEIDPENALDLGFSNSKKSTCKKPNLHFTEMISSKKTFLDDITKE
jgi:hypothetical protein